MSGEHDLFGGVVPHAFVATKVITHPLVRPRAQAPAGWAHGFRNRVRDAVLTASRSSRARMRSLPASALLARGPVRLKPGMRHRRAVVSSWSRMPPRWMPPSGRWTPPSWREMGSCWKRTWSTVTTHSVGQVRVAELVASYHGTQRLTPDNHGEQVYGGSDLLVVRGGFEALLRLDLTPEARLAVTQAQAYDAAATAEFPGLLRVAPQLRRRPGQRRPGPLAFRRA